MNTASSSFVKKVISSAMAFALTATMVPAAAFAAEGDEPAREVPEVIDQTHPVESVAPSDAASSDNEASAPAAAGAQISRSEEVASAGEGASQSGAAASIPAASSASSPIERVGGTVKLAQASDDVATFINYAGLNYAVYPDDASKVALVGWSSQPGEDLSIPQTISCNGKSYVVAGIVRGGVQ